ncbi:MAG: hypothetical protein ACXAD7_17470 [Candidatus Kariarchaeaceae archaeon]
MPSLEIWSFLLLIPLLILSYQLISWQFTHYTQKALLYGILLSLSGTILLIIGISSEINTYNFILILIGIFSVVGLSKENNYVIRLYLATFIIGLFIFTGSSLQIKNLRELITDLKPIFELFLLVAIILFNLQQRLSKQHLSLVTTMTILGAILGYFVTSSDVGFLIMNTVFEQTLGISQFSIGFDLIIFSISITTDHIFMLHFAEILNVGTILMLRIRSLPVISIILTGLDLSYPPLSGMRAIAILLYIKSKKKTPSITYVTTTSRAKVNAKFSTQTGTHVKNFKLNS